METQIRFGKPLLFQLRDGELFSDSLRIQPTLNGVQMFGYLEFLKFDTLLNFNYQNIRKSNNCVCFMESKFKPILVFSALCSEHRDNAQPLLIQYVEQSRRQGLLTAQAENPLCRRGTIEIDFYESKLLQDTPVSAGRPNENNAFGPVAFLGNSHCYGTQWLYCRVDPDKIPELSQNLIGQIKLFFPKIGANPIALEAYGLPNRFCSFGSNWNNKVPRLNTPEKARIHRDYICVDLTNLYVQRGQWNSSSGFVMIPQKNECRYQGISTGDCYSAPPILYVSYKK